MEQVKIKWLDLIDQITIHPKGQRRSSRPTKPAQPYVYVDTRKER